MLIRHVSIRALPLALAIAPVALGQVQTKQFVTEVTADGTVLVEGVPFASWNDYFNSDLARALGARCGMPDSMDPLGIAKDALGSELDCSLSRTTASEEYDPSVERYRIPVVVHVLVHANTNAGFLGTEIIQSQIDILNEDFLALTGTNGQNGSDLQIEFYLADTDPAGQPTIGITWNLNVNWFADNGDYYEQLAWDTNRYVNIYTNTAGGNLGYVPGLPQHQIVGQNLDRIVINYEAFGRNSPLERFDLGRTATHEMGHYLGLFHIFNRCDSSTCDRSGDRVCDTAEQSISNSFCDYADSCSLPDSTGNYMDYIDDPCMSNFTPHQGRRMRCTLLNYRPDLFEALPACVPSVDCNNNCIEDASDLLVGTSLDANDNRMPDECEYARGDSDLDGTVGVTDFLAVLMHWGACPAPCPQDSDVDGNVGITDFLNVLANWG